MRFHDMRHLFTTLSLKNGVDVKTLSSAPGHYSTGFTLNTYTHTTAQGTVSCFSRPAARSAALFIAEPGIIRRSLGQRPSNFAPGSPVISDGAEFTGWRAQTC